MEEWFHAHVRHHEALISAIQQTYGVNLTLYPIYPVLQEQDFAAWNRAHQALHDGLNATLGIAGVDLTGVDFKDEKKTEAWMYQHFLQHQAAGQRCGLPV